MNLLSDGRSDGNAVGAGQSDSVEGSVISEALIVLDFKGETVGLLARVAVHHSAPFAPLDFGQVEPVERL